MGENMVAIEFGDVGGWLAAPAGMNRIPESLWLHYQLALAEVATVEAEIGRWLNDHPERQR